MKALTQRNINFLGRAITVRSTDPNDPAVVAATVIDGMSAGSVVNFSSGEKSDSVLSGLTIKNGKAANGGGIYCINVSSPTIGKCIITGNAATSNGGGIYCYFASPGISNCSLSGNSAPNGGGIYCDSSSLPTITNCTVSGNSASSGGGGIYCTSSSSPAITNCMVSGNSVSGGGGGIYCNSSSSPAISNCMINENSANNGGGIFCYSSSSPEVTNCLLARNAASNRGGGVYTYYSSPVITNCTLARNSASTSRGGGAYFSNSGSPKIINCILWSDSSGEINCSSVTPTVTYSDIRGGYTGTGNISDNPSFVNSAAGNYHLRADSPCIDAGTDSGAPATDIEGNPRPLGAAYDMGAYEYKFDFTPPQARCKDITVQLDSSGNASITANQIDNGSSDDQGIASLAVSPNTFTCANIGPNTVTLTVTDTSHNVSTCTATVTVEDNVAPVAVCKNITVQLDASGNASISAADIDNGSSDACGIVGLMVNPNTFTCANIGPNTVTLTVTDTSHNVSTCTATVTVEDNVAPVAICKNITVQLDATGNATITADQIDNGSSDNCGIRSITVSPSSFTRADVGNNSVVLTVTDTSDNTAQCSATVQVKEAPVLIGLEQFTALPQGDRIILTWTTLSEVDNAGFNLWRSESKSSESKSGESKNGESKNGNYIRINPKPIAAEGGATLGAEYSYTDNTVDTTRPGITYYYKLEEIDTKGVSTFHGPVSVSGGHIN